MLETIVIDVEMKLCPWCFRKDTVSIGCDGYEGDYHSRKQIFVECSICNCRGPEVLFEYKWHCDYNETKELEMIEKAICLWNREDYIR